MTGFDPVADVGNPFDGLRMNIVDTYFLTETVETAKLGPWAGLLPRLDCVLRVTLFADVILRASDGSIHLLEPAAGSCSPIAAHEDELWNRVQSDEEGWQLRPLVEKCLAGGKRLGPGMCYAFTTLPLLGGKYEPENVWISSTEEWMAFTGDIYLQTKDLPDGTTVELIVQ